MGRSVRAVSECRGSVTVKVEPTPVSALYGNISAQEPGEAAADRQAQARAAILPGTAAIHLTKFLKDER